MLRDAGRSVDLITGDVRPAVPAFGQLVPREPVTVASAGSGPRWRVASRKIGDGELVVGVGQADVDDAVGDLRRTFLLISACALVLMAVTGYVLVRRSTRPLEEVEAIAAGDLSQRVPVRVPGSEVGNLATALNTMLGQIESAFEARATSERQARGSEVRMRRFVADASHELRTPLTSIRGYAELFRQGATPAVRKLAAQ
ncbi:hypothetical protein GCM10022243_29120 [Saccharothrix violaceirubra]|uniref:histidine kinase n=1 Tax=Saccharothrix violaceirubra TaxID=413306 RepID=A0A7W7T9R1_9PSEU|nr:HAMP domain-containing sensor histidine kinase [Saccharothrix violaceirubra]MBB4969163.1 signal transduction histidine kinase [Saccharothrix violaceirubra]